MSRRTILIVEDDPDIRSGLATLLEGEGYAVLAAADGREALDLLRGHELPAIILLDIMMPVMNGLEFRRAQLRDPALAAIPVVVLTADGRFHEIANAVGATAMFAKPFEIRRLIETIDRVTRSTPALASA